MEANGQFIKPSAWLPPGHDPGAASGEATIARQRGRWPSTFWLSSLGRSGLTARAVATFACDLRCERATCDASVRMQARSECDVGGRALGPVTPASCDASVRLSVQARSESDVGGRALGPVTPASCDASVRLSMQARSESDVGGRALGPVTPASRPPVREG